MMRRPVILAFLIVGQTCASASLRAQTRPDSVHELESTLHESWKHLHRVEGSNGSYDFRIQFSSTQRGAPPEKSTTSGRALIKEEGQRAMIQSGVVYARNHSYSFLIAKDIPAADWKLTALSIHPDEKVDLVALGAPHHYLVFYPLNGFMFGSSGYSLLQEKRLTFRGFRDDPTGLINADFELRISLGKRDDHLVGNMLLDPKKGWAVVECRFTTPKGIDTATKGWMRRELVEDPSAPGGLVCRNIETDIRRSIGSQTVRIDFSDHSAKTNPDAVFRLSQYGLPEPIGLEQPRNRRWIWIVAVGLSCLGIGLAFFFVARRGKSKPT